MAAPVYRRSKGMARMIEVEGLTSQCSRGKGAAVKEVVVIEAEKKMRALVLMLKDGV